MAMSDERSPPRAAAPPLAETMPRQSAGDFASVYREHFAFVFRSVRRLGVPELMVDDAVQEVFVVVHRRLGHFAGRSSLRTWLFGIVLRVARDYRRAAARRGGRQAPLGALAAHVPASTPSPLEAAERGEASRLLHRFLDELDDDKRAAFVMVEIEQMTVPEAAEALGANVDTVYSRLRVARQKFEQAVLRHHARDARSTSTGSK